ncbi:ARM repeat-containing protein [Moesziomyces antarcticus]|uniref:Related to tRNA Exportin n=2 Tax=Pseudozyma antarctica TaxID=84753 RepID=A0A5C3FJZ1_PSEA2|nr:ARM repeat-containing protein [Moesziomyces antarcticus]GAK64103.1 ARM repeat-containing protein [Moesziomyces antarcticus]SPO44678.1 related to tRNA Exportin [Moesziomyces antarcticus]
MEEQLIQAVDIASNPLARAGPDVTSQALQFLEHLKTITHESWSVGWSVWSARNAADNAPKYSQNARMFGLMLVDDFLENRISLSSDPAAAVASLQQSAIEYIQNEYVSGNGDGAVPYIKNKFAQVLAVLLLQTYNLPPPYTLLPTLLSMIRAHPTASPSQASSSHIPLNPLTTDLVLRVLHDLSVTLGSDVTLRAVRSKERLQRDAVIRDEIRANHAANIAESVWRVVEEGFNRVNLGEHASDPSTAAGVRSLSFAGAVDLTAAATKIVEDYVSWIDINLVVSNQTVSLLFNVLHHPIPKLRTAAADALHGIVSKGMKPADKLSLAQALNLPHVITPLESQTRTGQAAQNGQSDRSDSNIEFREHLARLTNGLVLEMSKILEESAAEEATKLAAEALLNSVLPLVLAFLSDEYDDASEQMFSGVNMILAMYKKARRRGAELTGPRAEFLSSLIGVALQKMKFDDDAEWPASSFGAADDDDEEEDEDDAKFLDMRRNLQTIVGAIAAIDDKLFSTSVAQLVLSTFASFEASAAGTGAQLSWQQIELALYVITFYGDVMTTAIAAPKVGLSPAMFVQSPEAGSKGRAPKLGNEALAALPLSDLGEMVQKLVQSNVSSFPHPAVQLQFFECLVRYSNFFAARSACVSDALPAFLDWRGVHHEKLGVRKRVNYLLYRFVRDLRAVAAVPLDYVQRLLQGLQDLLVVRAELPEVAPDEDPLEKATGHAGYFDSQLYLLETSGILISLLNTAPQEQLVLLKAISEPLSEQMRQAVQAFQRNAQDLTSVLQVHHLMLALSSLSKGFPDVNPNSAQPEPQWVGVFKAITEQVLLSIGAMNSFAVVREAARGAFARMVSTCGKAVLPYIPGLIDALLSEVTSQELVDFVNFLSLVVNKYKDDVKPIVDQLFLMLVERIFFFLNQSVMGTDDAVHKSELQKAYMNLLSSMVQSGMEGVFVSDKNAAQLETLLQSVVFYSTNSDAACQRTAFSILHRLVAAWGGSSGAANGAAAGLPGFERFIYETLIGLIFEAPTKDTFDLRDAQAQIVLGEIATLAKTIYAKRGDEAVEYLTQVYFPGIHCPPEMAADFAQNLKTLEAKPFKKYLEAFIVRSRGG